MGDLTYTQIEDEVEIALGNRNDIVTQISTAINLSYKDIAYTFQHFELEILVSASLANGTRRYTLPSDCRNILSVRNDTQNMRLEKVDWREFDSIKHATQKPVRYARFANLIELDPTPDAADTLFLRYVKRVPSISGTEKTLIGAEWDEGVILGAVYRLYGRLQDFAKEEAAKTAYLQFVGSRTITRSLDDEDVDQPLSLRR